MDQKTSLLLLTEFERIEGQEKAQAKRVFINPHDISAAVAFGRGLDSGVEFLFKNGETLSVHIWDTHLYYLLSERLKEEFNILIFDRRVEQEQINTCLFETFGIQPYEKPKSTSRERASSFGSRKQQKREKEDNSNSGRGRPCQICEDEFDKSALITIIDEGTKLVVCPKCAEELAPEGESTEEVDEEMMAKLAIETEMEQGSPEDEE